MPSPLTLSRTIRSDSHLYVRKLLHFCMRVRWCRATFLIMGCRTQLVDADGNVNVRQKDCSGLKSDFLGIAITKPDFRSSPRTVGDGNPNSHCSTPWALATMRWTYYETECRSDGGALPPILECSHGKEDYVLVRRTCFGCPPMKNRLDETRSLLTSMKQMRFYLLFILQPVTLMRPSLCSPASPQY